MVTCVSIEFSHAIAFWVHIHAVLLRNNLSKTVSKTWVMCVCFASTAACVHVAGILRPRALAGASVLWALCNHCASGCMEAMQRFCLIDCRKILLFTFHLWNVGVRITFYAVTCSLLTYFSSEYCKDLTRRGWDKDIVDKCVFIHCRILTNGKH